MWQPANQPSLVPLWLPAAVALLSLGGCAGSGSTEENQAVRDGSNCVTVTRIRSTEVIDQQTILFHMTGGPTFRNTLPAACAGLSQHDAFEYRVPSSQLCRGDIITVLNRIGPGAGTGFFPIGACALGDFDAISREEVQALRGRAPAEERDDEEDVDG